MLRNRPVQTLGQAAPGAAPAGSIILTPEQGEQIVRTVEAIITFAEDNPIEFHSYCPPSRWASVLDEVGRMTQSIESQLAQSRTSIFVSSGSLLALFDIEECVTGARDEKLSASRKSLAVSAFGAVAGTLLGIKWLAIPSYLVAIAIAFGSPALAATKEELPEPFKIDGPGLGHHTDKAKLVERIILRAPAEERKFYWGIARNGIGPEEEALCLVKGEFRVRVEGLAGVDVAPGEGWVRGTAKDCASGRNEIAVWESCQEDPRETTFGPIWKQSGFARSLWADYTGPFTAGRCRRAGPFG